MPPMVQRECVEGSTGKNSCAEARAAFSVPSTMPGSTRAVRAAGSTCRTRLRCLEKSMTSARFTVCPHWLVPPPRASTGTPSARATAIAATTSSVLRGTTTPIGIT